MPKTSSRCFGITAIAIGVLLGVGPSRPIGHSRAQQRAPAPPTFYRAVLPILQQHCQVCHRSGGIAPMPFEHYGETRFYASAISKTAEEKTMPPWFADPSVGHFSTDPSLSAAEIATLVAWAEAGSPAGDKKDAPPRRHWLEGWSIPKPDLILKMPQPALLPASGDIEYTYEIVPTHFIEDRYYRVEARGTLPNDATLLSLLPHMHLRGSRFEYNIVRRNEGMAGKPLYEIEPLLRVHYHFHWQMSYRLAEPRFLKAGTELQAVAWYNNSEKNPPNPDPRAAVRWGEQTYDEMMVGFLMSPCPHRWTNSAFSSEQRTEGMAGRGLARWYRACAAKVQPQFVPVRYLQFDYAKLRKFGSAAFRCVTLKNWSFTSDSIRDDTDPHRPAA